MRNGVIVDLETTGLDPQKDRIVEIGLLEFKVSERGPVAVRSYGALEDPGATFSAEASRVTGLTNEDLAGQAIDWGLVRDALARSDLVIAHNMEFDRAMLHSSGKIEGLRLVWACSMRHVDWRAKGHSTTALNYLAADHGFVNPFPHRAIFDCATTLRLVGPHLDELVVRCREREFVVRAENSPYETKDILRERGYRWDVDERVWLRVLPESRLAEERDWLSARVYGGGPSKHVEVSL